MCSLRISGPRTLTVLLTATLSLHSHAQSALVQHSAAFTPIQPTSVPIHAFTSPPSVAPTRLPDAPSPVTSQPMTDQSGSSIVGTVLDSNGAEITDALVTLENEDSRTQRTLTTDGTGFFKFDAVEPGRFSLTVTSTGFTTWVSTDLATRAGQSYEVPPVELQIESAKTENTGSIVPSLRVTLDGRPPLDSPQGSSRWSNGCVNIQSSTPCQPPTSIDNERRNKP